MEGSQLFKQMIIKSKLHPYKVSFNQNAKNVLQRIASDGDILLVDNYININYSHLFDDLSNERIPLKANETLKSYRSIEKILNTIVKKGFRRTNKLIAIGGGITQDVTSFIAFILFRGVPWVFLPSNLLSQCDSCIGSKLSVNLGQYKNLLGGFYPPKEIYVDLDFLKTLNERDILSGLGEMLHYFLISGPEDTKLFSKYASKAKINMSNIDDLIYRSLLIKKSMIELDEFDKGPRNIFNYGHTFAHALESVTSYGIPHGIAVSFGIDLANLVSVNLGLLSMNERNNIRKLCQIVFEGIELPEIDLCEYEKSMKKDKKNKGNQIGLILTRGLGKVFKRMTKYQTIKHVINYFYKKKLYLNDL